MGEARWREAAKRELQLEYLSLSISPLGRAGGGSLWNVDKLNKADTRAMLKAYQGDNDNVGG